MAIRCRIASSDSRPDPGGSPASRRAIEESDAFIVLVSAHVTADHRLPYDVAWAVGHRFGWGSSQEHMLAVRLEPVEPTGLLEFYRDAFTWLDAAAAPIEDTLAEIANWVAAAGRPSASGAHVAAATGASSALDFSVTAPRRAAPGSRFMLNVWAHRDDQRWEVLERAQAADGRKTQVLGTKGPVQVDEGATLQVHVEIEDLVIPEPVDTLLWIGEISNARFIVRVPEDITPGFKDGKATISYNGLYVLKLSFLVGVTPKGQPADATIRQSQGRYGPPRKAFASYASADRDEVLARVQGIQKVAPQLEIFLDVLTLRSGQYWEKELWSVIPTSDIFYLFWSANARRSSWVEKEWRCALETRGLDFIDPVPLVPPRQAPPPPELKSKHFFDWTLAFRSEQPPAASRPGAMPRRSGTRCRLAPEPKQ